MTMSDKPNFALLIGKPKKEDNHKSEKKLTEEVDHESDLEKEPEEGGEHESMENSAVADFMAALASKNVPAAKQALKDFMELCEAGESEPEEEPSPSEEE